MRAWFNVLVIAVVTLVAGGCSQAASPTRPSSVAPGADARLVTDSSFITTLAQLALVDNHVISANHQLTLYVIPPNPAIPGNPVLPQSALDFYVKANGVLDTVAIPGNPITPQWNDALNALIGHANITRDLVFVCDGCIPGNPIFPVIADQANHTIETAIRLLVDQ
jgi:hypothetical protein